MVRSHERTFAAVVFVAALLLLVTYVTVWAQSPEMGPVAAIEHASDEHGVDAPAVCAHLVDTRIPHQLLIEVSYTSDNPPPPASGTKVEVRQGKTVIATNVTDAQRCATFNMPGAGSFVFDASVEQPDHQVRQRWWSDALMGQYDGDSPSWMRLRLNGYERIA